MSPITDRATLNVYDRDGVTLRGTVQATGLSWVDELGDVGIGTHTIPRIQPVGGTPVDTVALLDQALVKVAVPLSAGGAPTEVFAWLTEPGRGTLIDDREEGGLADSTSCLGLLSVFDDWVVQHDGGFRGNGKTERYFGFMSRDFDTTGWSAPQGVRYDSVVQRNPPGLPVDWALLDPDAQWTAAENPETPGVPNGQETLYRTTVTVAAGQQCRIYATADDHLEVYVDAELWLDGADWKLEKSVDIYLPPGDHVIAVRVTNGEWPSAANITGLLFALFTLDAYGEPDQLIRRSDTTNWVAIINDPPVGETAARILLRLIGEAVTEGVPSAGRLVPTFTASTDSAGVSWPDVQDRAFAIGAKGGAQVLGEFKDTVFDIEVRPDWTLNAYVAKGTDKSATVTLEQGWNLKTLTYDARAAITNRVLVRTADVWQKINATSTDTETRMAALVSGYNHSPREGAQMAAAYLDRFARTQRSYTAVMYAMPAADGHGSATPYVDFTTGDVITCPNYHLVPTPMQVVAIGGQPPDDSGSVPWIVELVELQGV